MIMLVAIIALYFGIGAWISIAAGEQDKYTIAACGLVWLPFLIWHCVKAIRRGAWR